MPPRHGADVYVGTCELGKGLFAGSPIPAGSLILPLSGRAFGRQDPIHRTPEGANLLQTGPHTYILLEPPAVFANHSCEPNAGIRFNRQMVAIRDIAVGEEIRFDYSTTMDEDFWTLPCRCGEAHCRGLVTDFDQLPEPLQRRYLDMGIVQGFIAARARRTLMAREG